jgi:hypothetical protein
VLRQPLEAITFDDTAFKHDAEDSVAERAGEKCWRSVLLMMMRRPCHAESPLDGHDIDGYTPRSPRD